MSRPTVGDVERALAAAFPPEWAEEWDRIGLLAGDPGREVTGVTVALDPTLSVLREATAVGDNVVVTHHPVFVDPPSSLVPAAGPTGVVFSAVESGVALVNAHTNLDRSPQAGALLPQRLELVPLEPVEQTPQPMALVTVFAPAEHADRLVSAMSAAGAGRVGEYSTVSFTSAPGVGAFLAGDGTSPAVGDNEGSSSVAEVRIEMVAPRNTAPAVVAAARDVHPYEEPLISTGNVNIARSAARLGMLAQPAEPTSLADLATRAKNAFSVTPRVWGDPQAPVERVVTATGSAGALVPNALASGATAMVAGEVRYHDALNAMEAGLSVIELGHDVSEWPLVSLLEKAVLSVADLDPVVVHVLPPTPGWWTP